MHPLLQSSSLHCLHICHAHFCIWLPSWNVFSFPPCQCSLIHPPLNLTLLDFACVIKIMSYFWMLGPGPQSHKLAGSQGLLALWEHCLSDSQFCALTSSQSLPASWDVVCMGVGQQGLPDGFSHRMCFVCCICITSLLCLGAECYPFRRPSPETLPSL